MHINYDYLAGMFEGFDYYQSKCNDLRKIPEDLAIEYLTMKLCSEVGKLSDIVQDRLDRGEPLDFITIMNESLGDTLSCLVLLIDRMGLNLSDVAFSNLNKELKSKIDYKVSKIGTKKH